MHDSIATPKIPGTNWFLYLTLVMVTATGPLALNMFMPSIPGLVKSLSTTPAMAQLTLTLYLAGTALSQLAYGPLSDRFGRRPVLLTGLLGYILASALCAMATSIEMLVAARLLQSFGGAAGMVLTRAIIRDMHDEKSSASVLGYVTMAWAIAPMIAPALGGYLDQLAGWRTSFWALSIYGMAALAMAATSLPETNIRRGQNMGENRLAGYQRLLKNRKFLLLAITLAFTSGAFFAFLGGAPFIMINVLHQSPLAYGLWFSAVAIGYMVGNFLSGKFSRHTDTRKMITIGIIIAIIAAFIPVIAALTDNLSPAMIFIPTGLIALGNGITLPNATASALSSDAKAIGSAAGLTGFLQTASGALIAQIVGSLQGLSPLLAIWLMLAGAMLAGVSYWLAGR